MHRIEKMDAIAHALLLDEDVDVGAQPASLVTDVELNAWGELLESIDGLCNRRGRYLHGLVFQNRKEAVQMSRELDPWHGRR